MDHTTAYGRRRAYPDFRTAWDEALVAHREGLAREDEAAVAAIEAGALNTPSPRSALAGAPLAAGKAGRWTEAAERRFFAALADQANVKNAARAAGFSTVAVYKRRAKNKVFAAAWDAAVETGKARLQILLIDAAERSFDPELIVPESAVPKVSASEAIRILQTREGKERERKREWEMSLDEEAAQMGPDEVDAIRERILQKLARLRERELPRLQEEGWQLDGEHLVPPGWVRA